MLFRKALAVFGLGVSLLVAQGNPKDDRIYDKVRMKLAADTVVGRGAIDVTVKDGQVTLEGKVRSDKHKQRAEHLSKKVKGVTGVVNRLRVEYP
jgi:osmotically-inducible protein OsmY